MKNIVLIAGHSIEKPGAIVKGIKEYSLSKVIVDAITFAGDLPVKVHTFNIKRLLAKIDMVNRINPDLAIELHWNACNNNNVKGSEVFHYPTSKIGKKCAEEYCSIFEQVSGVKTRGAKPDNQSQYDSLAWCRKTKCPAILIENEFLTYKNFNKALYYYLSVAAMMRFFYKIKYL